MVKYHLAPDGFPKRCRAVKVACPYGSIQDHFNTIEEGQAVADGLNEQLASQTGFGIATDGNWKMFNKETELTVVKLNNLRISLQRLENIKNNARAEILKELQDKGIKKLSDEYGTLSHIAGSERTIVDTQKVAELDPAKVQYYSPTWVSEHTRITNEENEKLARFEKRMVTPSGKAINFEIEVDENGVASVNEETKEALAKLKKFEETIAETKKLEKELRNSLMEKMKEAKVNEIKVGLTKLEYVPKHERLNVDSGKLKLAGVHHDVIKKIQTSDSVRITWKKDK